MKKRQIHLMLWAVLAVFLLASCSKVPKSAQLIPEDAIFVLRVDVKQIADKSGFDDDSKAKKKLTEALKEADMSRAAREKAEAILDDPAKAGLDLRDPLFIYGSENKSKEDIGIVGSILNKDDFTDLLNTFAAEADIEKVKEKEDVSYFVQNKIVVVYNNDCFFIGEKAYNQEVDDFVADVKKKFDSDGKNTMAESDDMKKMCSSDGIMQLLFNCEGLTKMRDFNDAEQMLPGGLKYNDLSYLFDLSVEKGEATLNTEVIAKSDAWKEQLEKSEKLVGNIGSELTKYISNEGLAIFANIDGAGLYDMVKDSEVLKKADADSRKLIQKLLTSVEGDMAFDLSDFKTDYNYPVYSGYILTKDKSIVDLIASQAGESTQKTADGISQPLAYDWGDDFTKEPTVIATSNIGFKNNTTYFVGGAKPEPFKVAAKPFSQGDIKGKGFYACFNFDLLNKIANNANNSSSETLKMIANVFDKAELYYEGDGKAVLTVTMKDKEHTPIESIMDMVLKYLDYQVVESA
jgi:hypothetical protein